MNRYEAFEKALILAEVYGSVIILRLAPDSYAVQRDDTVRHPPAVVAQMGVNGGVECDTYDGACACGAWHHLHQETWKCPCQNCADIQGAEVHGMGMADLDARDHQG